MAQNPRWILEPSATELAALDAAVAEVAARGLAWHELTRESFPLTGWQERIEQIRAELEDGSGLVKLRGIPEGRHAPKDLTRLWIGLGQHLGRTRVQHPCGELPRET